MSIAVAPRLHARVPSTLAATGVIGLAVVLGVVVTAFPPKVVVLGVCVLAIIGAVAARPRLAAYGLTALTPLVAGIDRGRVLPVLRPAEALALLLASGLILRALAQLRTRPLDRLHIGPVDRSILILAIASSVIPLAWMAARHATIEQDDVLYALMLWKYYAIYLIIRTSLRTGSEVRTCLWIGMISASIVGVVAVLQSLELFGITRALSGYFTPYGDVSQLTQNRGGSTLSLPIAVADLMTFNLAVLVGFWRQMPGRQLAMAAMAGIFVCGAVASGEFSGIIALVVGLATIAFAFRSVRLLRVMVPALLVTGLALWPVISARLVGFQSASGLPTSWQGRINNLTTYFWPQLFSHGNFILGVRVAARVPTTKIATGFIWIESGYTWLLWSGGIPLLLAFFYFAWTNLRRGNEVLRGPLDAYSAAALGLVTAMVVIGVLMLIDPHLTYRGSADYVFALLAIVSRAPEARRLARGSADKSHISAVVEIPRAARAGH